MRGDGRSTLQQLILANPRMRKQLHLYREIITQKGDEIPDKHQIVSLGDCGNHARGAIFRDGEDLITPQLEAEVNRWFAAWPNFRFGRMDVRGPDFAAIARGEGCRMIEVNGLSSESTNIYDPDRDGWFLWKTLIRQWAFAFEIGRDEMRHRRHLPSAFAALRLVLAEYRT